MMTIGAGIGLGIGLGLKKGCGRDSTLTFYQRFLLNSGSTIAQAAVRGPPLTFTRAGPGTNFDENGLLVTAGTNAPCLDHDPLTKVARGLLYQGEDRINEALWNRDLTNPVWVKSNTTAAKDATGLDGAANSASTLTATAANGTCLQTVTKASAENAYSVWVRRKTGTGNIDVTDNNGTNWTTLTGLSSSVWTRYKDIVRTQANPIFGIRIVASGDEVEVDVVQLEAGAFSSSEIITTTPSVLRAKELLSTTDLSWYADGNPGTFYIRASLISAVGASWRHALEISDNTADNRIFIRVGATDIDPHYRMYDGTVSQFTISPNNDFIDGVAKQMSLAYATDDIEAFTDGVQAGTDSGASIPTGLLKLRIGARYGNVQPWFGHIEEVHYYTQRRATSFIKCYKENVKTVDKFIRCHIGSEADESFTDSELNTLASNYDWITINRGHGNRDRDIHQADCLALRNLNSGLRLSTYVSMSFRDNADFFGEETFLDSFYLRDVSENKIEDVNNSNSFYIDLGNAEYRQWMLDQITVFMNSAPWDGVHFDNCLKIAQATDPADWRYEWDTLIGQSKIDAYNAGLTDLLSRASDITGVTIVTWNGIARHVIRPNRSLEHLDVSDGAGNERFVVKADGTLWTETENIEDVDLMVTQGASGKIITQFSNTDLTDYPVGATREQVSRYALGIFMLGWLPGVHYFKFGDGFTAKDNNLLTENAEPIDNKIGLPVGAYDTEGNVYRRHFVNGVVYVNMEATSQSITTLRPYHDWSDGSQGTLYQTGSSIAINSEDALFLLDPIIASSPC